MAIVKEQCYVESFNGAHDICERINALAFMKCRLVKLG
jgi:hypothetical protein